MRYKLTKVTCFLLLWIGRVGGLVRVSHVRSFFATTIGGMEPILAKELEGLSDVSCVRLGRGGVEFRGSTLTGLEGLLWLRTPLKLMEKLAEGDRIRDKDSLHRWVSSTDWTRTIPPQQTLKCDVIMGRDIPQELSHSHFTALTIKNAIVDQFRDAYQTRPSVDLIDPDLPLLLYLHQSQAKLYRVWSGEASMHKRGYRPEVMHRAALRETTAAALLLSTEWPELARQRDTILCDPMCGSGTIAIEAALMASDTAPGLIRYGGLPLSAPPIPAASATVPASRQSNTGAVGGRGTRMNYSNLSPSGLDGTTGGDSYQEGSRRLYPSPQRRLPVPLRWLDTATEAAPLWESALSAARQRDQRHTYRESTAGAVRILANDHHAGSIALAEEAARKAGVDHLIEFSCADIARYSPSRKVSLVVTNPPWEKRLEDGQLAWEKLAAFLQMHYRRSASPTEADTVAGASDMKPTATSARVMGGGSAWVFSGNPELERTRGLDRPVNSVPLRVATVEARFNRYDVV